MPGTQPFDGVEGKEGDVLPQESYGTEESVRCSWHERWHGRLDRRHRGSEPGELGVLVASDRNPTQTSFSSRRELMGSIRNKKQLGIYVEGMVGILFRTPSQFIINQLQMFPSLILLHSRFKSQGDED